jgi:katanin p60 ATPase-containing subunit A1
LTALQNESNLSLKHVVPADNMDLMTILQEYENYYSIKFGKTPKLSRKIAAAEANKPNSKLQSKKSTISNLMAGKSEDEIVMSSPLLSSIYQKILPKISNDLPKKGKNKKLTLDRKADCQSPQHSDREKRKESTSFQPALDDLVIAPVQKKEAPKEKAPVTEDTIVSHIYLQKVPPPDSYESKLLKPMPEYGNSEFRELANIITR